MGLQIQFASTAFGIGRRYQRLNVALEEAIWVGKSQRSVVVAAAVVVCVLAVRVIFSIFRIRLFLVFIVHFFNNSIPHIHTRVRASIHCVS